jgi:1,4-dihydroxy-2-naphthoate octaprenyltransferase
MPRYLRFPRLPILTSCCMRPVIAWWLAIRPKTLSLAATPVLVGNSLAWSEQAAFNGAIAAATLLAAVLIQIGTNLHNDAADHARGADGADRLGPPRAAAQGWLSGAQIRRAAAISFTLAVLLGAYLASVGGWPIVCLGLASVAAGYAYTGGPKPIAYSASGELFVFLFFGLLAVNASYYLQTQNLSMAALGAGMALGLLAAAVLMVNNYRDLDSDRKAGKLTLCHWLGRARCRWLYSALLLLPFVLIVSTTASPWRWLTLALLPAALWLARRLHQQPPGAELNRLLAATAQLQLGLALLMSIGYLA